MAKLEITVSRKGNGKLVAHETFEISRELAQELIAKMEAMIAELPGQHRTGRTIQSDGTTIVEIELNRDALPPLGYPSFEDLFRHKEDFNNDPKTESPSFPVRDTSAP